MRVYACFLAFFMCSVMARAEVVHLDPDSYPGNAELLLFFDEEELYVEAASLQREPLYEAPAVTNIITRAQILAMGARTLTDILVTIPGFTDIQDTNEHVLAGRGIYATSTHKFLLLRDGHRLNEPLFEEMMLGYAVHILSIKRIEVMRGPGASIYGNAALLGVINIVTLDQNDPQEMVAQVQTGNFGQQGASFLLNQQVGERGNFLLFGSTFRSSGENVAVSLTEDLAVQPRGGEQVVEGRPVNFDVGIKYRSGNGLQVSMAARRAAYKTPRSNDGAVLGVEDVLVIPEQAFDFRHLDIRYLAPKKWHGIRFSARQYTDGSQLRSPQYVAVGRDFLPHGKAFQLMTSTRRVGIELLGSYAHTSTGAFAYSPIDASSNTSSNTLLVGVQGELFSLEKSLISTSFSGFDALINTPPLAPIEEINGAIFIQEKYRVGQDLVLNGGMRLDHYQSFGEAWSPRLAAMYQVWRGGFIKASYAQAFQAPSYFYRTENDGLGYGAPDGLTPEHSTMIQLSFETILSDWLWLRSTFYENDVTDLIAKPGGSNSYQNISRVATHGVESEINVSLKPYCDLFFNHSYSVPDLAETDTALLTQTEIQRIPNIPTNQISGGFYFRYPAWRVTGAAYANWHGEIISPIDAADDNRDDAGHIIPAQASINSNMSIQNIFYGFDLSVSVFNILDQRDYKGGTTKVPYPQVGRSILGTLTWRYHLNSKRAVVRAMGQGHR